MFDDFKEALDFELNGNVLGALDRFKRVQEILKNVKQEQTQNYIYIRKKMAFLSLAMYQYADAEEAFNDCLDISQEITNNPEIIYSHYHNLFTFYLKANLKKGILMGKAL